MPRNFGVTGLTARLATPTEPPMSPIPVHGDMRPEEFRSSALEVIDWITEYLAGTPAAVPFPVQSRLEPGEIAALLPPSPPDRGEDFPRVLEDFRELIVPGITHWNNPGFFAYFATSGSAAGILAEALIAALNVNAMLWRTSPAATELEAVATGWLRQLLGLPDEFRGHLQDTASTSTLVAIATAREATGLEIRDHGMSGRSLPRLRLYCSEESHSSIEKAAIALGIGRAGVSRIPTDESFRLDAGHLRRTIEMDLAAGAMPFCIVATIGTTSTTSVDPVDEIANISNEFGLWLHVDAAYAGAAAIVPEKRHLMAGWDRADSIVVNPHKWLFVPLDCSALFLRDEAATRAAFSIVPEYLTTPEADRATNLMDYGPALGRRFRALKLWMTLRYFGREGIADRLRAHIDLAAQLAGWIEAEAGWQVLAPVPFSTVCFRFAPRGLADEDADRLNGSILKTVNRSGEVFLSHTSVRGRYSLRVAIGNIRTEEAHVRRAWELLTAAAAELYTAG
jgi:aromatic-L-amino-acid/L-tryptophan decarboxylase